MVKGMDVSFSGLLSVVEKEAKCVVEPSPLPWRPPPCGMFFFPAVAGGWGRVARAVRASVGCALCVSRVHGWGSCIPGLKWRRGKSPRRTFAFHFKKPFLRCWYVGALHREAAARCPLPAARCPLPAARCPLPAARCPLPAARCPLPAAREGGSWAAPNPQHGFLRIAWQQIEITERTMAHVGSNEVLIVGGVGCTSRECVSRLHGAPTFRCVGRCLGDLQRRERLAPPPPTGSFSPPPFFLFRAFGRGTALVAASQATCGCKK